MPDNLSEWLNAHDGWSIRDDRLRKSFQHPSFPEAMAFVNRVAELAEELDHHPDIDIRYADVSLSLWTHTAGGVTGRDLELAGAIERAATAQGG